MKKAYWFLLASLAIVVSPAVAQSQFQSTFELGIGYTRPATESIDMASLLLQSDDYFFETGIGARTNTAPDGSTVFSWLVRAAVRPFLMGNTTGHLGGELSLHTNSAVDQGATNTLVSLGLLAGVAHPLSDHLSAAIHVYPFAFEFGREKTVTKIGVAEFSAHILF